MEEKRHYISLYFDFRMNSWIYRDDSNISKINSPFDVQKGIEVMLFYIGFHVSQELQRQFSRMPIESSQMNNNANMPNFTNSNNFININNINYNMNMPNNNMQMNSMQMNNNQFGQYNQRSSSGNIFLKKGK